MPKSNFAMANRYFNVSFFQPKGSYFESVMQILYVFKNHFNKTACFPDASFSVELLWKKSRMKKESLHFYVMTIICKEGITRNSFNIPLLRIYK